MTIRPAALATALSLSAAPALAAPAVVADIAPVHSLAARVMAGVGEPTLLVAPGANEHSFSLRPSDAAALEKADVVVWIGEGLTPWLEGPLSALAGDAATVELMAAPGVTVLPIREGGTFEAHDHGEEAHGHDHGDDHAADAGHDHDHDHDHAADKAAEAAHGHAHGSDDPHLWLDPENAKRFLDAIATALAAVDPGNAATYAANAAAGKAEIDAAAADAGAALAPVRGRGFVVFHDAYQYFESRFGMPAAGAIALNDATAPSAARVAEVRATVEKLGATCVFAEPQFEPKLVATVTEGTGAGTGVLDPIGANLEPGPALYPALIRQMAASLAGCLAQ